MNIITYQVDLLRAALDRQLQRDVQPREPRSQERHRLARKLLGSAVVVAVQDPTIDFPGKKCLFFNFFTWGLRKVGVVVGGVVGKTGLNCQPIVLHSLVSGIFFTILFLFGVGSVLLPSAEGF